MQVCNRREFLLASLGLGASAALGGSAHAEEANCNAHRSIENPLSIDAREIVRKDLSSQISNYQAAIKKIDEYLDSMNKNPNYVEIKKFLEPFTKPGQQIDLKREDAHGKISTALVFLRADLCTAKATMLKFCQEIDAAGQAALKSIHAPVSR